MAFINLENLTAFATELGNKITENFVKKVSGKGLSSNDFTTAEKDKLSKIEAEANKYTHTNSGIAAGTYKSVTVNAQGHVSAGSNPTTIEGYGITNAANKSHSHGNSEITGIDAGKITSGILDIARIPQAALERMTIVTNDTARFSLTTATVQKGDTVKVTGTKQMYLVVDDTKLSSEAGYEGYTAGTAASVPWGGVSGKPAAFTPSAHTHTASQISDLQEATSADIDNIIAGLFR